MGPGVRWGGSIKSRGSIRSSIRTRYKVTDQSSYVQGADESSWSDTEDEADRCSNKVKEGINTISGQKSRIAKVKKSVTLHPGQGAWVYLEESHEQVNDLSEREREISYSFSICSSFSLFLSLSLTHSFMIISVFLILFSDALYLPTSFSASLSHILYVFFLSLF